MSDQSALDDAGQDRAIRVLLVDDQELIRTGFSLILATAGADGGSQIEIVGEAGDGEKAMTEMRRLASEDRVPDVVLMDVRMPNMDGIEATKLVVESFPQSRVLVLTTFDLDEYALAAIAAGAGGFLLKDARATELIAAVRAVSEGDAVMAASLTRRLIAKLREQPSQALSLPHTSLPNTSLPHTSLPNTSLPPPEQFDFRRGDAQLQQTGGFSDLRNGRAVASEALNQLTEREREVLLLIAEGLSNAEIGERLFLSESTVKTHVGRVFAKLNLRDRVHAVILAYEAGLR